MKEIIIKGRKVIGGVAQGEALVTKQAISGWGGTNPLEGKVIERKHELEGCCFKDKILVFRGAKGSSGWTNAFHIAKLANKLPKGIIFTEMTTKIALGAVIMDIPAMTDFEKNPLEIIETGDWIKIDSDNEEIIIRKNK
ncbi:aconitase X swivel domain-containing protein [Maledivibacter halophilus]|uniref:Predicted aconitase subunit 2 n=1 Tax=Maledivibacter halophilus TaxID=36842 RepID=A0A1T5M2I5_9FIRM|nr:DUF126 domain-containing protein [Maledivibacter halophilus]SKC82345.1 predicted aconitase subunit 2 [Maledivibacter halophilus]